MIDGFGPGRIGWLGPYCNGPDMGNCLCCCWWNSFGYNYFGFQIGPLVSGDYRLELWTLKWPNWTDPEKCPDAPWQGWGTPIWSMDTYYNEHVSNELNDYTGFARFYYLNTVTLDTVSNGQQLEVFEKYWAVVIVGSTKRAGYLPRTIIGHLRPEDGLITDKRMVFSRWPEGDYHIPCEFDQTYGFYAYKSDLKVYPFSLWDYTEEEWHGLKKNLDCDFYGHENYANEDLETSVNVLYLMHLDCLNDTTKGFIPVKGEKIDFDLMFSSQLGLDENSVVYFNVFNNADELVHQERVWIIPQPDPHTGPFLNYLLSWDGQCDEQPTLNALYADPDDGPFKSQVYLYNEGVGSNWETFGVFPLIDSVKLTHVPSYPQETGAREIDLFAVVKAKVDDTGDPAHDYRYYKGWEDSEVDELAFWKKTDPPVDEDYHFWDLGNPKEWYYEAVHEDAKELTTWKAFSYGELKYEWFVTYDKRYEKPPGVYHISYGDIQSMSSPWGTDWKAHLHSPADFSGDYPFNYSSDLYMRYLTSCRVSHINNSFTVQELATPTDSTAHKVIFEGSELPDINNPLQWAVSHVGVPYEYGGRQPYRKIDCSGLVTAAKIQTIGAENNHNFRLWSINANAYLNGYYSYGGHICSTLTLPAIPIGGLEEDGPDPYEGDLIHFKPISSGYGPHIAIIFCLEYNYEEHEIEMCYIVEAKGMVGTNLGRVRVADLLEAYNVYNPRLNLFTYNFIIWQ